MSNTHVLLREKVLGLVANIMIEEAVRMDLEQPGTPALAHANSPRVGVEREIVLEENVEQEQEKGEGAEESGERRRERDERRSSGRSHPDRWCVLASIGGRWLMGCGHIGDV